MNTPIEQTIALPDGNMQYEVSSVPVRVEQGGEWIPVDTDLISRGEWFEPAASAVPVRFSAGGSDELAQIQTDSGEWISERWPYGDLPSPQIDGDTATYVEVLPGVDLKMVATKTGSASIYVVKTESAAKSNRLEDLHVFIEDAELTRRSTGTVDAAVDDGSKIVAGQPLWWDSSDGGTYREPGGEDPVLPVTHEVETDRVLLDVGDSVVQQEDRVDEDVTYPIFVDPDWSSGITSSWYTDAAYPNQSYLSAGASNVLRVGIYEHYRSDMFFQFPISALAGKVVSNARLNTTQLAVASSGAGGIQVHTYGVKPAGFTWAQEQAWNAAGTGGWSAKLQPSWVGPGYGSPAMAVGWAVTSGVQAKVGASTIQFAFTYSSATLPSRRHYSRAATLVVTYNSRPNTPTEASFTSPLGTCSTNAATPTAVGASDVAVKVKTSDPDAGNVGTDFYVAKASALSATLQKVVYRPAAQGWQTGTFTGLQHGETYAWRAQASDTKLLSGFTPWCYFTVDTVKPDLPVVTAAAGTNFVVGEALQANVAASPDTAGYVYWVSPGQVISPAPTIPVGGAISLSTKRPDCNETVVSQVRWACAQAGSSTSLAVAPTDALSTLWVSAFDAAGNQSAPTGLPLYPSATGSAAAAADLGAGHAWQTTSMPAPLGTTIPDSNPHAGGTAVSLLLPATTWADTSDTLDPPIPVSVLRAPAGAPATAAIQTAVAPVDASQSFTMSMWVRPTAVPVGADQTIAQQAGSGRGVISLKATADGMYAFCITGAPAADDGGRPVSGCAKGGAVSTTDWQMVSGIWDAANKQIRLHVGSSISPVAATGHVVGSGDWSANGPLKLAASIGATRFTGYIANPVVVPAVLGQTQLAQLSAFELPF